MVVCSTVVEMCFVRTVTTTGVSVSYIPNEFLAPFNIIEQFAIGHTDSPGGFWAKMVLMIPVAYLFAWFWTSSVAIYLLLRRSVDATPLNEVYRVAPPKVRTLPTIKQDEHGAPEIKESRENEPQM
jgi:hypothetical protein